MYSLILFICYLHGGCEALPIETFRSEQQCLNAMDQEGIRNGGCYPWQGAKNGQYPAHQQSDIHLLYSH